jgi:hypothetical protein
MMSRNQNNRYLAGHYLDEKEMAAAVLSDIHKDLQLMLQAVDRLPPACWWNDAGRERAYFVFMTALAVSARIPRNPSVVKENCWWRFVRHSIFRKSSFHNGPYD